MTTHCSFKREAPHLWKKPRLVFSCREICRKITETIIITIKLWLSFHLFTCHGHCPGRAFSPETILGHRYTGLPHTFDDEMKLFENILYCHLAVNICTCSRAVFSVFQHVRSDERQIDERHNRFRRDCRKSCRFIRFQIRFQMIHFG